MAGVSTAQQVDHFTGRLSYGVALGSIQANDISIGVSLQNHCGSVRVAEGEGSSGVGWSLASAGGSITRQVRGLPDDYTYGWKGGSGIATAVQSFSHGTNDNLSVCTGEDAVYTAIKELANDNPNPKKDTEPDIFYVNAPGLSAQFVFGTDGLPKLLSWQDLDFDLSAFPGTIKVTNAHGVQYIFGQTETIYRKGTLSQVISEVSTMARYYPTEVQFTSRWNLESITSQATGTQANFQYTTLPVSRNVDYLSSDSTTFLVDEVAPKRISQITLKTYTLKFSWLNDLLSKVQLLESTTQDSTIYTLEYTTVQSDNIYKAFLRRVRQVNNCAPVSSQEFEYNGVTFGQAVNQVWTFNSRQDFFGYHNGQSSNKNNPILYFYNSEENGRRLRVKQIPGLTATTTTSGDNRSVSTSLNSFGALSKIKFPTGGYVTIEYDSNTYKDTSVGQELTGGGVRVKKITRQGSEVAFGKTLDSPSTHRAITTEYQYKLADNSSSGVLMAPVNLGYITAAGIRKSITGLGEEPAVLYSRVTELIPGQGKRVYEYQTPGVFPDTTIGSWSVPKSRIARKGPTSNCISAGNVKNGYYLFPFAPATNSYKRGLISKVSEYTQGGTLIRERIETTTELTSDPVTIKGLRFERIDSIYYYAVYSIHTGRVEAPYQTVVRESSELDPTKWLETTTTYSYNALNMLSQVSVALPDGTVNKTYHKYIKDLLITTPNTTPPDTVALAVKKLRDQNRMAEVVETRNTFTLPGGSEQEAGSSIVLFREFHANRVLPQYMKVTLPGVAVTPVSASSSALTIDTDYKTVTTFKSYDTEGRVLALADDKRKVAGSHYATGASLPAMTIANARAQHCIYEGFEYVTSFGLTTSGSAFTTSDVAGWTGEKGIRFGNSTDKLISSSTNQIVKGSAVYRISCWMKAGSGKSITFTAKQGGTTVSSSLNQVTAGAWNYLEGTLSLGSITGSFTLEITTNATAGTGNAIDIDDIVFIPSTARISFQTYKAFKGVTSATDDRGNSNVQVYDDAGRPLRSYDRDRNLVSKQEYLLKSLATTGVNAMFSSNASAFGAGDLITFTAGNSCGSGNRTWKVDGVTQSVSQPALTMSYTFTPGPHTVTLIVDDSSYGVSQFDETVCIEPGIGMTAVALNSQGQPITGSFNCNTLGSVDFTVKQPSFWFLMTEPNGPGNGWVATPIDTGGPQANITYFLPQTFVLKAVPALQEKDMCGFKKDSYESWGGYSFYQDPNQPCQ